MENRLKHPLAEDWRWRHIRLATKPHCLANHASQIKKLLGNAIGKSWSLLHNSSWKKGVKRHPGGKMTMTSYPACNKTSLYWIPCILDKHFGSLSGSHGRSFRIRYEKSCEAPPGGGLTMTWGPVGNTTSLSRKPCIADKQLLLITIMKSWSLRHLKKQQLLI